MTKKKRMKEQSDRIPSAWEIEEWEKEEKEREKSSQIEDQIQLPNPNDEASWYWDELSKKQEEKPSRGIEIIDIYGEGRQPSLKDVLMLSPHVFPFHSKAPSSPSKASKMNEASDMNEGGYAKLMRSLTGQEASINTVGIITAENPFAKQLSPEENKTRNKQLSNALRRAGYGFYQIQGKYGNVEKPYVIPNISKQDLMELGRIFEQESVIFVERDGDQMKAELIYTDGSGSAAPSRNVILPVPKDQEDFYSTYKGRRFVIPFFDDFFQGAKMKGGKVVKEVKLTKKQLEKLIEGMAVSAQTTRAAQITQSKKSLTEMSLVELCELDEDMMSDKLKAGQSIDQLIMGVLNQNKGVPVNLQNLLKAIGATDPGADVTVRRKLDALTKRGAIQFGKDQQGQEAWMKKKGWFG